jgi:hypothetical protein
MVIGGRRPQPGGRKNGFGLVVQVMSVVEAEIIGLALTG